MLKIVLVLFFFSFTLSLPFFAKAEDLQSPQYIIEGSQITTESTDTTTSAPSTITYSLNPTEKDKFNNQGYIITNTGMDESSIQFSITDATISFETIKSNTITKKTTNVDILLQNSFGFQTSVQMGQALTSLDGDIINATSCDQDCSENVASIWQNPSNYGTGYNVESKFASYDFKNGNYFRPFSISSNHGLPVLIMKSNLPQSNILSTFTMGVDPSNKNTSVYNSSITFITLPTF